MLGKQAFVMLRETGEVGYDLVKGDLVAPNGRGEHIDILLVWQIPAYNGTPALIDAIDVRIPEPAGGFWALPIPYNEGTTSRSEFHTLYEAP